MVVQIQIIAVGVDILAQQSDVLVPGLHQLPDLLQNALGVPAPLPAPDIGYDAVGAEVVAAAVMAFFLIFPFGATKEETAVPVSTERPIQIAASALGGHLSTVAAPSISSQQDSFLSQQPVIISKDSQYGEFVSNTGMRPSVSALDVLNFAFQDDTKSILMEVQLSNISNINSFYGTVLPSALFLNIVGQ